MTLATQINPEEKEEEIVKAEKIDIGGMTGLFILYLIINYNISI